LKDYEREVVKKRSCRRVEERDIKLMKGVKGVQVGSWGLTEKSESRRVD